MTKYTLAAESGLYRITAAVAIPAHGVDEGDPGGLVSGPHNLSQSGSCWVGVGACVTGGARVDGDALVEGDTMISGEAYVGDSATVGGGAFVSGNSCVRGTVAIDGPAVVSGWTYMDSGEKTSGTYMSEPDDEDVVYFPV